MSGSLASNTASGLLVLDAWPVMEWLKGRQPVASSFEALLAQTERREICLCISRINLGEIRYSVAKDFGESAGAILYAQFLRIPVEVVSVTDGDIDEAARLKAKYAISYADSFAAVLSIARGVPLITGDPEFKKLAADGLLTLHWLGK